eukprot:81269_1
MATYKTGQIIEKYISDKQGQRKQLHIPKWMQKNAPIPDHVAHLKCEKIELPYNYCKGGWVVLIRDVFTKQECDELIQFSERIGYEDALVNIGYGRQQKIPSFRNCKRMMIDNYDMIHCLWSRTHRFIPTYFNRRRRISFNERLRFLRYYKGEFMGPHFDGTYVRANGERSQLTFLLYLNDGFKGGNTTFLDTFDANGKGRYAPNITQGMVVMFQHDLYHEGSMLEEGRKYIIRTDVMYTSKYYSQQEIENDKENMKIQYVNFREVMGKDVADEKDHNDDDEDEERQEIDNQK